MAGVLRIVSGGQTGVDRAALDAALAAGVSCGGWCPAGRSAEDGVIAERYPLSETRTEHPEERTKRNVQDSDGTLVFDFPCNSPGTHLTIEFARALKKPLLTLDPSARTCGSAIAAVVDFIESRQISAINVAGPRASEEPQAYDYALEVMTRVVQQLDLVGA